jgi:serine/threonine protein kinase
MIRCEGVLLHLAILQHGEDHLILLPWAKHIDLQIFLLEGKDLDGNQVYDFDAEFPGLKDVTFIKDVYTQMANIAEALEWLHKGINTGGPDGKKVYFAHMDLKPNNILIDDVDDEEPSTVGKWVLTDFGISARKGNDEPVSDDLVSIGDVSRRLQSLTINTDPPRGKGSYQPPEVDLWYAGTANINNQIPRQGVGRKGDIWSIGCIFAEVIAFSVGRSKEVERFQGERVNGEDDFFYEWDRSSLKPHPSPEDYILRRSILPALRTLIGRSEAPNNLIDCAVRTVEEILQPLAKDRPTGSELFQKIKHVEKHLWAPQTGPNCPLDRLSQQSRSRREQSASDGRQTAVQGVTVPQIGPIVLPGTASDEARGPGAATLETEQAGLPRPPTGRSGDDTSVLPNIRISVSSSSDDHRGSRQQSHSQSSSSTYAIDPSIRRQGALISSTTKESVDPTIARVTDVSPGKIKAMCLSPKGDFVVTIKPEISTAETQHFMEYFEVSLSVSRLERVKSTSLPKGAVWSSLSVGGESFVTWSVVPEKEVSREESLDKQQELTVNRKVYFGPCQQSRENMHWKGADYKWLPLLQMAVVSSDGTVVFMCRHSIYYVSLK